MSHFHEAAADAEIDWDAPTTPRVRPAPGIPTILVAHLGSAPKPYVYVGRAMKGIPGSPLGNPYRPEHPGPAGNAIESFRHWLRDAYRAVSAGRASHAQHEAVTELRRLADIYRETGRLTLACWCANGPCHADVIADAVVGLVVAGAPYEITIPGVGPARAWYDRELGAEGLPWVVTVDTATRVAGRDVTVGHVIRASKTLAHAREPLAPRAFREQARLNRSERALNAHEVEFKPKGTISGIREVDLPRPGTVTPLDRALTQESEYDAAPWRAGMAG